MPFVQGCSSSLCTLVIVTLDRRRQSQVRWEKRPIAARDRSQSQRTTPIAARRILPPAAAHRGNVFVGSWPLAQTANCVLITLRGCTSLVLWIGFPALITRRGSPSPVPASTDARHRAPDTLPRAARHVYLTGAAETRGRSDYCEQASDAGHCGIRPSRGPYGRDRSPSLRIVDRSECISRVRCPTHLSAVGRVARVRFPPRTRPWCLPQRHQRSTRSRSHRSRSHRWNRTPTRSRHSREPRRR